MATKDVLEMGKRSLSLVEKVVKKKPEGTISVSKEGKEWKVLVEALERKAVPDTQDILGRYELRLDAEGELLGYKQVSTKKREDLISEEEEKGS